MLQYVQNTTSSFTTTQKLEQLKFNSGSYSFNRPSPRTPTSHDLKRMTQAIAQDSQNQTQPLFDTNPNHTKPIRLTPAARHTSNQQRILTTMNSRRAHPNRHYSTLNFYGKMRLTPQFDGNHIWLSFTRQKCREQSSFEDSNSPTARLTCAQRGDKIPRQGNLKWIRG